MLTAMPSSHRHASSNDLLYDLQSLSQLSSTSAAPSTYLRDLSQHPTIYYSDTPVSQDHHHQQHHPTHSTALLYSGNVRPSHANPDRSTAASLTNSSTTPTPSTLGAHLPPLSYDYDDDCHPERTYYSSAVTLPPPPPPHLPPAVSANSPYSDPGLAVHLSDSYALHSAHGHVSYYPTNEASLYDSIPFKHAQIFNPTPTTPRFRNAVIPDASKNLSSTARRSRPLRALSSASTSLTQSPVTASATQDNMPGSVTISSSSLSTSVLPAKSTVTTTRSKKNKLTNKSDRSAIPKLTAPLSLLTKDMTEIPVRDMDAWVRRTVEERRREATKRHGYVARPMNSFMLYRSAYAERTKLWCKQNNHQIVSAVSGESWPMEPAEVRERYNELAKIERINHAAAHPTYKFTPAKPNLSRKRKGPASGDGDEDSFHPSHISYHGSMSTGTAEWSTPVDEVRGEGANKYRRSLHRKHASSSSTCSSIHHTLVQNSSTSSSFPPPLPPPPPPPMTPHSTSSHMDQSKSVPRSLSSIHYINMTAGQPHTNVPAHAMDLFSAGMLDCSNQTTGTSNQIPGMDSLDCKLKWSYEPDQYTVSSNKPYTMGGSLSLGQSSPVTQQQQHAQHHSHHPSQTHPHHQHHHGTSYYAVEPHASLYNPYSERQRELQSHAPSQSHLLLMNNDPRYDQRLSPFSGNQSQILSFSPSAAHPHLNSPSSISNPSLTASGEPDSSSTGTSAPGPSEPGDSVLALSDSANPHDLLTITASSTTTNPPTTPTANTSNPSVQSGVARVTGVSSSTPNFQPAASPAYLARNNHHSNSASRSASRENLILPAIVDVDPTMLSLLQRETDYLLTSANPNSHMTGNRLFLHSPLSASIRASESNNAAASHRSQLLSLAEDMHAKNSELPPSFSTRHSTGSYLPSYSDVNSSTPRSPHLSSDHAGSSNSPSVCDGQAYGASPLSLYNAPSMTNLTRPDTSVSSGLRPINHSSSDSQVNSSSVYTSPESCNVRLQQQPHHHQRTSVSHASIGFSSEQASKSVALIRPDSSGHANSPNHPSESIR